MFTLHQMLIKMNNEAKVRRSTRSVVLRKAKAIKEAQINHAAQHATKGKGKRGLKRKAFCARDV